MATPYLGQSLALVPETELDQSYIVVNLDPDGSRRILRSATTIPGQAWASLVESFGRAFPGVPVVLWGAFNSAPPGLEIALDRAYGSGQYLPYPLADGIQTFPVDGPVNQIPKLLRYREHASRFAHQLDAAHGFNSTQTAAEEDSLITHQTLSAMLGTAWKRYGDWEKVDPEELIVGGNYDGTLLWKRFESDYDQTDFDICGQCNISTFARRFRKKSDLIEFRRVYRQGIIYSADRTTTPWSPHAFDIIASPSPYGEVYAALEKQYQLALDYYDDVVGPVDHA